MASYTATKRRRITISVSEPVVTAVRELSAHRRMPVSQIIADAVLAERRHLLEQEMIEGYTALAEENHALAEQAIGVDNETWPVN